MFPRKREITFDRDKKSPQKYIDCHNKGKTYLLGFVLHINIYTRCLFVCMHA